MKYSRCDRPQSTATLTTTTTVLPRVAPVVVPRYPLGLRQLIEVDQRVSTRGVGPALHIHIEPTTPSGLKKLTDLVITLRSLGSLGSPSFFATARQSGNVLDLLGFTATLVKPSEYPYLACHEAAVDRPRFLNSRFGGVNCGTSLI